MRQAIQTNTIVDITETRTRDARADDEQYLEMVRRIAGSIVRHLPAHVDREELISLGYMGLVEARERFDASRGVPFAAFAAMRVRGAMLDGLRQIDVVSRGERARLRRSNEAASVKRVDFACAESSAAPVAPVDEELASYQQRQLLWKAFRVLSERQRLIVQRYFFEEQPLKTIGKELGLSESRICQIVAEVVDRLRSLVNDEAFAKAG
ncbi:MAG TPA: sigma-70 family RNA polymerase sigma factor [Polyangia bacterium]|jgi:RNA polymerase sigma factor for flagellar operon FliA|nr:sigma-70 family RNA polymerase sigma factor [Polyangia bacterium]